MVHHMASTHLGKALILIGVAMQHVSGTGMPSRSPDCLATVDTCISDLCRNVEPPAVVGTRCGDEGCPIKGSEVCNMSVRAVLERFPSLERCMCAWVEEVEEEEEEEEEEEDAAVEKVEAVVVGLCLSLQALTTQCHQKPAPRRKTTAAPDMDWKASGLIGVAYDGGGLCMERVARCLGDQVCNRNLAPLLQACGAARCDRARCRDTALRFYGAMPAAVGDLLAVCGCESRDEGCRRVAATLHSGTCGEDHVWSCQEGVSHCLRDWSCRKRWKSFLSKCWKAEDVPCGDDEDADEECVSRMNPALLLGAEAECRAAFRGLMATPLQYPCTCAGLDAVARQRCDALSDILHNRSHFAGPWQKLGDSYKTSDMEDSQPEGHTLPVTGYLLYALICVVLIVIVLFVTAVILCKSGVLRKTGQIQFHPPGKTLFADYSI